MRGRDRAVYFTYIIYSLEKHRFYTGYSDDPARRLDEHNAGKTPSTKYGIPWKLAWISDHLTKTEAIKIEKRIKKRGAKRFLRDHNLYIEF